MMKLLGKHQMAVKILIQASEFVSLLYFSKYEHQVSS